MNHRGCEQAEIAIVGGGLAGLSLACHLLDSGVEDRKIVVLESRASYHHDRYWCSWAPPSTHPFGNCIESSWRRWRVAADGRDHTQDCPGQPYHAIPSGALYREAERRLTVAGNAELRLGVGVRAVSAIEGGAIVELTDGARMRASRVFDSRVQPGPDALGPGLHEVDWVQDFLGWRVRSDRPVFDPTTVTLMRFEERREDIRFVYVLPFNACEALVEATAFAPERVEDAEHEASLRRHLDQIGIGGHHEVLAIERGRIPMTTRSSPVPKADDRIVSIGTAAGLVKPSTGYAFEAVQRWSRAVARQLASGQITRYPAPRSARALAMDRMFLASMRRRPADMPRLFLRLFETVDPDALVRFLSDRGTLRDAAAVAMALPKLPMLGEAVRSLPLWARSA